MANLKNFRQFYLTFAEDEKGYTLCSLLSWSHIRLIMRIDNVKARTYYLTESKAENWSVRQESQERVKSLIDLSLANMPAIMGIEKFIKG